MENNRVEWVDIYKCLVIILVVVGHSTGLFNRYIYQFHMAAFFFISGYVANLEKKSFGNVLLNKFFTLLLPLFTFCICGIVFMKWISMTRFNGILFPENFPGILNSVKFLVLNGDIHVQFLGACWFISALFGIFVLQKVIITLSGSQYNLIYMVVSVVIYILGYNLVSQGIMPRISVFSIDLICIGQLFFALGCAIKESRSELSQKCYSDLYVVILVCNLVVFKYFAENGIRVDYPSRKFNGMLMDFLAALNGILFIYCVSVFLTKLPKKIKRILIFWGQNTMGVLVFHFLIFKICFGIFYKLGIMQLNEVIGVTPPKEVGSHYWLILTFLGLAGSLGLWELCKRIPILRFCIGVQKGTYREIYADLSEMFLGKKIKILSKRISSFISKLCNILKVCFKENPYVMFSLMVIIFLIVMPMFKQGIMCNDEVKTRFWCSQGFWNFFKQYFQAWIKQGRALAAVPNSFSMFVGFLGQSNWIFKTAQVLTILADAVIYGYLLFKLFKNKYFSCFCSLTFMLFLPITFEHTIPNAFVTLFGIPVGMVLCSMILFLDYLERGNRKTVIISMVLLLVAEISYEAFITFIPVYMMFVLYKYGFKNIMKNWEKMIWPVGNGMLFLILYIMGGKVFSSNYTGNQIGVTHVKDSLIIIKNLFLSSVPGYFLFTSKYRHLYEVLKSQAEGHLVTLVIVAIAFLVCVDFLLKKAQKIKEDGLLHRISIVICGIIIVILPSLPISVASMYQGNVGPNGFMALPVSFFGYFAAVFVCCYIIWQICSLAKNKIITQILVIAGCILFIHIQMMNNTIADESYRNFERLVSIEELIKSDNIASLNGNTFSASDLYITKNALAVHDGHWSQYASAIGKNIVINNEEGTLENNRIYLNETEGLFCVWMGDEVCVMSKNIFQGNILVHYYGEDYFVANCTNASIENEWCSYYFILEGEKLVECTKDIYFERLIGSDISSYKPIKGIYEDGWFSKHSTFKIRTGEEGIVNLSLYNPQQINTDKIINIYINGELREKVAVVEGVLDIGISTDANAVVECTVESDFSLPTTNGDVRELSLRLIELSAK